MLQLINIHKQYAEGQNAVHALKGINLSFRKSDFVSILGPSGCGKTTMLNIIGGLDQYTNGDLIIDGRSTKDFKDRDWDAYRNHSIGFVFQSYNLIPHQTVLQNVEIALSLGGVSKKERRRRAIEALEQVGLGDQLKKRPGEMSGGQMQRVAIARALVNNPEIILADEPTGALDTQTSVQVMDILKEISKDRLVIMVTHNPELALQYSTRIIRMLDGQITDDTNPLTQKELEQYGLEDRAAALEAKNKKVKKPSMSFATAFMLSLKNLFTKKGRTTLTAFAGSIGIIGIALILAISQGMTAYIDQVQESTLASYPLTLEATTMDMTSLMNTFMGLAENENQHPNDAVYKKTALYDMIEAMSNIEKQENDLKSFKKYLEAELAKEGSELKTAVNGVQYSYDLDLQIYTKTVDGKIMRSDLEQVLMDLMREYLGMDMSGLMAMSEMSVIPMMDMGSSVLLWQELLPGDNGKPVNDLLLEQYELAYGRWPEKYDEIVLVLDEKNEIDDMTLYALGLISAEEIDAISQAAMGGAELAAKNEQKWSYEEICATDYRVIFNADCYSYDPTSGTYIDLRESEENLKFLYNNAMSLKITGIIRPNPDSDNAMLRGSICYTSDLTKHVVEQVNGSEIIEKQLANPNVDVLTGLPFDTTTGSLDAQQKETAFRAYIAELTPEQKAAAYVAINSIPAQEVVQQQIDAAMAGMTRETIEAQVMQNYAGQLSISAEEIQGYIASMTDEELFEIVKQAMEQQIRMQYAQEVEKQMAEIPAQQKAAALEAAMAGYTTEQCAVYYDEVVEFSDSTYEQNLLDMGYIQLDTPATISIYASSFENKDVIVDAIDDYNSKVDDMQKIKYTDFFGIMMSSITTIINAITYVLIAFVAISLIVSSIMIGVITLISVQERTKEIGILRAIGASKRNVSSMFNAETVIVGLAAGLLGVIVTYLLCIPINLILFKLTKIANLKAILPIGAAVILTLISVVLTLISGLIPSRSAAKKDPVVALRTE